MATYLDLLTQAMIDLGEIQPGEQMNSAETANGLVKINYVLSSWSLEGITVYTHSVGLFSLTPGMPAYAMGPGAVWLTSQRPVKLKGASISYQGLQQGVAIMPMGAFEQSLAKDERIAAIDYLANGQPASPVLKAWADAALPTRLGEDSAAPVKNIRVHPVPTVSGVQIELSYWTPLPAVANLSDTYQFPVPGYEMALVGELSLVLAPGYGRPVTQELLANIQRGKQRITDINGQIELGPPPAARAAAPQGAPA